MKTMRNIAVTLALVVGLTGLAKAGGRQGQGWNVTYVTGTATTIFEGRGYLKAIVLSTGAQDTFNNYLIAFGTTPGTATGAGSLLMPTNLFIATTAVTPPLVFRTTVTFTTDVGMPTFSLGDCEGCYTEIEGSGGLHIRKNAEASGQANTAAVYWSQ